MNTLARCSLSFGAAALLAACGASQPPIGATAITPHNHLPARFAAEGSRVRPAYRVLYSFGASGDGAFPYAPLLNVDGTLYGTNELGGAHNEGTAFALTTTGVETVLHSFGGPGDGGYPRAGLVEVKDVLYGTTSSGGVSDDGTVFALTKTGTETVLYSLKGGSGDGEDPDAGVVYVNKMFYGTTEGGGAHGDGTVFAVTLSGKERLLHSFGASGDGNSPYAVSLADVKGALYGTTYNGGTNDEGTVFKITTSGTETVLHSFGDSGDGKFPIAGLLNVKGTLYGTTDQSGVGYGTVFAITTSGKETVLHTFSELTDGKDPQAALANIGTTLYGTTFAGGAACGSSGCGTVFATAKHGMDTILHSFAGGYGDGAFPSAGLVNVKGTFYGTTVYDGANGSGTVFSISP